MSPFAIPWAHCSVEFHPGWPITHDLGDTQGSVSQPLDASGGSVFLHYGPDSTLESYVGAWRERHGDGAQVRADDPVTTSDGLEGRRIALALGEEVRSRLGAEREVTPARRLVCNGFTIRSVPVLLGYLVPEAIDPRLLDAAERVVGSLSVR